MEGPGGVQACVCGGERGAFFFFSRVVHAVWVFLTHSHSHTRTHAHTGVPAPRTPARQLQAGRVERKKKDPGGQALGSSGRFFLLGPSIFFKGFFRSSLARRVLAGLLGVLGRLPPKAVRLALDLNEWGKRERERRE